MSDERTIERTGGWSVSPSVAAAALEDVLARQEAAWDRGERPPVEELLADHPEFAGETNAVLELVCNEVVLREERGERPSLSEYQQRFPDFADPLRVQWEVDRALFSRRSRATAARAPTPNADPNGTVAHAPAQIDRLAKEVAASRPVAGRTVGRYRVEAVLGRGGMGVAYRAWDPDLKRVVAVKMLRAADADASEVARFRTESEAIARVRHPNIVQVFDVGEDDGQPFFAMEFCAGGSLSGRLKGGPLAPAEAAAVVEQIARGVDAAHRQSVIHRDLKPANVLLSHAPTPPAAGASTVANPATATGSSATAGPAAGEPVVYKVTDFGLAKALDADDGQTRTGAILGTPSYMSPEQAFGDSKAVGTATDVYALGAILYECLTGRPPFQGASVADTLEQVRRHEPVPVRRLQPAVPADLETIALKCLQKEPGKRYASAADLADDLLRYLQRRPILARPIGPLARGWRWCRRNPRVAGLLALLAASLLTGLTGTTVMWRKAVARKDEAEANFAKSEASLREAFRATNESFVVISDDKLLQEPHTLELRRELLARSQPYFKSFVAQRQGDPAWKRELAHANARLAFVSQQLDPSDVAAAQWREAMSLWEELLRDDPTDAEARLELAKMLVSLAYQERKDCRWAEAEGHLVAALDHLRAIPDRETRGYQPLAFEALALAYLASTRTLMGNPDTAELHREAVRVQERAARLVPASLGQLDLGAIHFIRGQALTHTDQPDAGADELLAAVKLFRAVRAMPCREVPVATRNLANTLSELGIARRLSRTLPPIQALPEAAKILAEAHGLWDEWCRLYPAVADFQVARSETKFQIAAVGVATKQWKDAEVVAREALAARERLLALYPADPALLSDVAKSCDQVCGIAGRRMADATGKPEWAALAAAVVTASGVELDFLVRHAGHPAVGRTLAERIPERAVRRARLLAELKRPADARAEWDRAIRFAPPEDRAELAEMRKAAVGS
jgi:serine/threonine protein kinase